LVVYQVAEMGAKCSAEAGGVEDLPNLFVHLSQYQYFAHPQKLLLRMNPANYREKWEKSMKMVIAVLDKSKALMTLQREAGYSNLLNCQHFQ
jgi:hypothetical protein